MDSTAGAPNALALWPQAASGHAVQVDYLIWGFTIVTLVLTVPIFLTLLYFAFKYHHSKTDADRSNPVERSAKIELTWIVVPFAVTMVFFTWAAVLFFRLYNPPEDALEITAIGKQWMWKFQHPGGQSEINDLHVPAGQPVKITMISQDVIHALYVPALRIKADVLPGHYRQLWFDADVTGTYHILCTEFCGTEHSKMGGLITIMEPRDYQAWLDSSTADMSLASAGAGLFRSYGCSGCHGAEPSRGRAPSLEGVYGRIVPIEGGDAVVADERYIRDSILTPRKEVVGGYRPIMPAYAGRMPEEDVLKLMAYIKRIGGEPGDGR